MNFQGSSSFIQDIRVIESSLEKIKNGLSINFYGKNEIPSNSRNSNLMFNWLHIPKQQSNIFEETLTKGTECKKKEKIVLKKNSFFQKKKKVYLSKFEKVLFSYFSNFFKTKFYENRILLIA